MITKWIVPSMRASGLVLGVAASCFAIQTTNANAQQVTAAQREACTPDALKFCSDAIPDAGRVKACMLTHRSELSGRCQSAFGAVVAQRTTKRATQVAAQSAHATRLARTHGVVTARSHSIVVARRGHAYTQVADAGHHHRGGGGYGGFGGFGGLAGGHISAANVAMGMRMAQRYLGVACAQQYLSADACGQIAGYRQFIGY